MEIDSSRSTVYIFEYLILHNLALFRYCGSEKSNMITKAEASVVGRQEDSGSTFSNFIIVSSNPGISSTDLISVETVLALGDHY